MMDALIISNALLWTLVLVLLGLVFVLARQVGVLHERIAPAGALALSSGPTVGEEAPRITTRSLAGKSLEIGVPDASGRNTLLFFASPSCPVCKSLLPTARQLARDPSVRLVVASDGDDVDHLGYADSHGIEADHYTVSRELGLAFQIPKLPYAVLIDSHGIVRAQGLVNTREHLESLFEANELGVASIQDYLESDRIDLPQRRLSA